MGHIEQIRDENIVILFLRQAQPIEQGGELHDLPRGAITATKIVSMATRFQSQRFPGCTATQEALCRIRHQE